MLDKIDYVPNRETAKACATCKFYHVQGELVGPCLKHPLSGKELARLVDVDIAAVSNRFKWTGDLQVCGQWLLDKEKEMTLK